MSSYRKAFALAMSAFLSSFAAAADGGSASAQAPVIAPLFIIAPMEVRADPTLAKGCWARLFSQPGLKGEDLTVAGPIELPHLHTPEGVIYWKKRAESLLTGPKATVTLYEAEDFKDRITTYKPASQILALQKTPNHAMMINSLKVQCEK